MYSQKQLDRRATAGMEDALIELQYVKTFDYDSAYRAALGGMHVLRPLEFPEHAATIHGRLLALSLWARNSNVADRLAP